MEFTVELLNGIVDPRRYDSSMCCRRGAIAVVVPIQKNTVSISPVIDGVNPFELGEVPAVDGINCPSDCKK